MSELQWLKSSFSDAGGNNCVEVAATGAGVALRESESPGETLHADRVALRALLVGIKAGRLAGLAS